MNREKEIKQLLYLKSELIRQTKKEIKELRNEYNTLYGYKAIERDKQKRKVK